MKFGIINLQSWESCNGSINMKTLIINLILRPLNLKQKEFETDDNEHKTWDPKNHTHHEPINIKQLPLILILGSLNLKLK